MTIEQFLAQFCIELLKVVAVIGAAYVAARLTIVKYFAERRFERTQQAYDRLFESMQTVSDGLFRLAAAIQSQVDGDGAQYTEISRIDVEKAERLLNHNINLGKWYISEESVKVLIELGETRQHLKESNDYAVEMRFVFALLDEAHAVVAAMGKIRQLGSEELERLELRSGFWS